MGKQPKELLLGYAAPTATSLVTSEQIKSKAAVKSGAWWNRLPQLLNLAQYRLQSRRETDVLDYDPLHLHITPAEVHPLASQELQFTSQTAQPGEALSVSSLGQRIALDSFRFLIDQMPGVLTIEFSGQHQDPFENPDLLKMVNFAYKFNSSESTIVTNGLLLADSITEILNSHLHQLVVQMVGHRPSSYSLLSGRPLTEFMTVLNNVESLLQYKKRTRSKLQVELRLTIDFHNYTEIPAMILFAENLGVDAVCFENYLAPQGVAKTDRTLYSHQKPIVLYLQELERTVVKQSPLNITLPKPLAVDMSSHRHCKEAFSTVSVDAEFNVSGCSRHLLFHERLGKIWDENFFNNSMYQWMRSIYTTQSNPESRPAVPVACQSCPRNLPSLPPRHTS